MAKFDFEAVELDGEVEWPKRGRNQSPIPEPLAKALHTSFENGATPNLRIKRENQKAFYTLLGRVGGRLNYRIERTWKPDPEDDDYIIVYFRVNGRRKNV